MNQPSESAPITFWPHLLTFFADRSRLGVHQFRSITTYFDTRPTQFSPHILGDRYNAPKDVNRKARVVPSHCSSSSSTTRFITELISSKWHLLELQSHLDQKDEGEYHAVTSKNQQVILQVKTGSFSLAGRPSKCYYLRSWAFLDRKLPALDEELDIVSCFQFSQKGACDPKVVVNLDSKVNQEGAPACVPDWKIKHRERDVDDFSCFQEGDVEPTLGKTIKFLIYHARSYIVYIDSENFVEWVISLV
jgi:hypothetical protein